MSLSLVSVSSLSRVALLPLCGGVLLLSACASTPQQSTLYSGISPDAIAKSAAIEPRKAEDPVCVSFYANAAEYQRQAAQPNRGANFLASVGLSALVGAATGGIGSGISSTAGRYAAQSAISTASVTAGNMALKSMRSSDPSTAKIKAAADALGCPVTIV